MPAMKVLLRNKETGLLYAGPEKWTNQRAEAIDFERPDFALDTVSQAKLQTVEVLMQFEEPVFDLPLTIVSAGGK